MAGIIRTKPILTVDNDNFYAMIGKSSQEIVMNGNLVYSESGSSAGALVVGYLPYISTPGLMHIANIGTAGVDDDLRLSITVSTNPFGLVKPGEEFVFRLYSTVPVLWLVPHTAGTFKYQVDVFED